MHGCRNNCYTATQTGNQWPGSKQGDLYLTRPTEHGYPVICSLEGGHTLTLSTHEGTCRTGTYTTLMAPLIASNATTSLVLLMNDCTWLGTGTNHT